MACTALEAAVANELAAHLDDLTEGDGDNRVLDGDGEPVDEEYADTLDQPEDNEFLVQLESGRLLLVTVKEVTK